MEISELEVKVNCGLSVDQRTAEACLNLVQIYLNAHPDVRMIGKKLENGEVEFSYEPT